MVLMEREMDGTLAKDKVKPKLNEEKDMADMADNVVLEGDLETKEEILEKETSQSTDNDERIKDLRDRYNKSLSISDSSSDKIGGMVRMIDLGDVQTEIQDTFSKLGQMAAGDGAISRLAMKVLPAKWVKNMAGKRAAAEIEGETVSDVSRKLIQHLEVRRNKVEDVFGEMEALHNDLVDAYKELDVILADIDEAMKDDSLTRLQRAKLTSTKTDIMKQKSNHEANIVTCVGAMQAADKSLEKFGELLPSVRSDISNGLALRASIKQLSDLSEVTDMVVNICDTIRTENMDSMEHELINVIKRSSISKEQIKAIENNNRQRIQMQQNVQNALLYSDKSREEALEKLEKIELTKTDNLLGYEVKERK